jgi:hypothetical protein
VHKRRVEECVSILLPRKEEMVHHVSFFIYIFSAPLYDSFSFETYFVPKPTRSTIFYSFFYSIGSICFCSCILRFVLRKGKIDMVADKRIVKKHLNAKMKYITLCTHSVSSGSNLVSILMFLFN